MLSKYPSSASRNVGCIELSQSFISSIQDEWQRSSSSVLLLTGETQCLARLDGAGREGESDVGFESTRNMFRSPLTGWIRTWRRGGRQERWMCPLLVSC